MSEKRFTLTDWHEVKDNGEIMTVDEVINMLNEQQDSIYELNFECADLLGEKIANEEEYDRHINELEGMIDRLQDENENLRKERTFLNYKLKVQDRIIDHYEEVR